MLGHEPTTSVAPDEVVAAAERIAPFVRWTPTVDLEAAALGLGVPITLKLELLQCTGSFKARGAVNALLAAGATDAPVVAASGGNFGLAVAFAARELGRSATIVVTESTSPAKLARLRETEVQVEIAGPIYADALATAQDLAARTGALMLHAYDQPEVAAGQGTCALELLDDRPDVDTVLVAVGGGGLLAGVVAACPGSVRVVAVETEGTPTLARALEAGAPVDVEVGGVAVDSLGATRIGDLGFAAARRSVAESILVTDDAVRDAQARLWRAVRVAAEPGGATAVAALTAGAYRPEPGERAAAIVCGGNVQGPAFAP
jgi:threonine dehydratase